jgi:predicted short-subunit dehydrogenase-like oxidoreductase (DUF2520 family)
VGKTLGYLLAKKACFEIKDILCQNLLSSLASQQFIQAGNAVGNVQELEPVDVILIAVKDDQLPAIVTQLAASRCLKSDSIIFHVSGSLSHEILLPLKSNNRTVASLHPAYSFSDPNHNIKNFTGTYCTLEGDAFACEILEQAFSCIKAIIVKIAPQYKLLYHIATIFSSNYVVGLIEISLQLLEQAGLKRAVAFKLLQPLISGTISQIKVAGTTAALTGPIARGDVLLVKKQFNSLLENDPKIAAAYQTLGEIILDLAQKKQNFPQETVESLRKVFQGDRSAPKRSKHKRPD